MASTDPEKYSLDHETEKNISEPLADAIRQGSVDKKILQHSHDADEAMKAFQGAEGQVIEIDAATNKRLLRRIDWNLMPVIVERDLELVLPLTPIYRSCASYTV